MARAKYSRIESSVDKMGETMRMILSEYGESVNEDVKDAIAEVRGETVSKLYTTSPKRPGGGYYAEGWTSSNLAAARLTTRVVVHNATRYRLTHLLEKGHVSRNGTGRTFGFVAAKPHIEPVNDWAQNEVVRRVKERIAGR